jgi:S-adenosylmethionine synthetase
MSYPTFASESVSAGHADKICDQISDAIVDAVLAQDPMGRVAAETAVTEGHIFLMGEVGSTARVDYEAIARREIKRIGYTDPKFGFSDQSQVHSHIGTQSPEIAKGVVEQDGAGDQGMMFGFACQETPELMPMPITLAHALVRHIDQARTSGQLPYLRPDGKAQVVVRYNGSRPVGVDHVTIAVPHSETTTLEQVRADLLTNIVRPTLAAYSFELDPRHLIINGTGVWHHHGPATDAGLTGRKIVVDSYGGYARVGGGAFSGKDPSKVDRSGAYAARFIAKNIVAAGLAERAEVALAYVIGQRDPVMREINTFHSATVSAKAIADFADSLIDLSVAGIIERLNLRRPLYRATAAYGHFGQPELPWEETVSAPVMAVSR